MMLPFILSIPHCGVHIPPELRASIALSDQAIAESEDFGTREIFAQLPALDVIAAHWSRLVVDLNRPPHQYDAKGVVALADYFGRRIFHAGREPDEAAVKLWVARFHKPYYDRLAQMLRQADCIGLIDCHSLNGTGPPDAPDSGRKRRDVILSNNGDPEGRLVPGQGPLSCTTEVISRAADAFASQGFSVALNTPYRGGHITRYYGGRLRAAGRFAMQIEMNQDLYMTPGDVVCDSARVRHTAVRVERALAAWAGRLATSKKEG